jgi:hypothetical protein
MVQMDHAVLVSREVTENRITTLFVIRSEGLDQLRVTGTAGTYTLNVGIAGDVNADKNIDGNDANSVQEAETNSAGVPFGQTVDTDINGDGRQDFADRLVLLSNYGFTPINPSFSTTSSSFTFALEPGSDDYLPSGDQVTARGSVTLAGTGQPFANLVLSGQNRTAMSLLNGMFAFFNVPLLVGPNELVAARTGGLSEVPVSTITVTRTGQENTPPSVSLALKNDTGWNVRDRISSDATLVGTAVDPSGIRRLEISSLGGEWIDITSQLNDGRFEITPEEFSTIFKGAIADGRYDLQLRATDALANVSDVVDLSFVLDRSAPEGTSPPTLSFSSDSGFDDSDAITNRRDLLINAESTSGERVDVLLNGQLISTVLSLGQLSIPVVLTQTGTNTIVLVNRDDAGNPSAPSAPLVIMLDEVAPSQITAALSDDSGALEPWRPR